MSRRVEQHADPYSASRVRRSLAMFAAGKALAVVIGFGYLLVLVRALAIQDYAAYVVLIAVLEIVHLVSSLGVYSFAQRYVTEARLPANLQYLPRLVSLSLAYRAITLLLATALLLWTTGWIASAVGQPAIALVLPMYTVVIVLEGLCRYLELVFDSLLEQARSQFSAVVRYGLRFALVLSFVCHGETLTLEDVIQFEMIAFGVGLFISLAAIASSLRKVVGSSPRIELGSTFGVGRIAGFAFPLFIAQVLTQIYGADAVKLIVSRLLGAVEAAAFGFAHTISFMLQRYLPANLLVGLIRPVLVARRAGGADDKQLVAMGNLIVKVNHFLLAPLAAMFAIAGNEIAQFLSGGKYPAAGFLIFLLTCLLFFQALHVVLSVVAAALEDRRVVLLATLGSVMGIAFGCLLIDRLGTAGMVFGLWLSEIIWCTLTLFLLRRRDFRFRVDWAGWAKLGGLALAAGLAASFFPWQPGGWLGLLVKGIVLTVLYLGLCAVVRPFSDSERDTINRMLPKPVFIF